MDPDIWNAIFWLDGLIEVKSLRPDASEQVKEISRAKEAVKQQTIRIGMLEDTLVCKTISSFEECDGMCADEDSNCPDVEHFVECRGCLLERKAREQLQKENLL
jgi:hypothetical protein